MSQKCLECGTTDVRARFRTCQQGETSKGGCGAVYCFADSYRGKPCPHCGREKGFLYAPDENPVR